MKMKGQIYRAFVNAGFEEEARSLSTTDKYSIANKGIIEVPGRKRSKPAIGHYIALFDSLPEIGYIDRKNLHIVNSTINAKAQAISKIYMFLYLNREKIPSIFKGKISGPRGSSFRQYKDKLNEFTRFFNKENN